MSESSDHAEDGRLNMRIAYITVIGTVAGIVIGGLITLGATVWSTGSQNSTTHSENSDARRALAYSSYLGELAEFNELVYSAVPWAGTDPEGGAAKELEPYYAAAPHVAATLQADYAAALLGTPPSDRRAAKNLNDIRTLEQTTFQHFKCAAGLQQDPCGGVVMTSRKKLLAYLASWSEENEKLEQSLIADGRPSLN